MLKKVFTAFLVIAAFGTTAVYAAIDVPSPPNGYVLDQANILSPETEAQLESELAQLETDTSTEIAVLTIDSLQDYPIEDFSIEVGRAWGIGQKGNDNGILVTIAPTEREIRIEVGYGLEGAITDLQSGEIISEIMTPAFHIGDYDTGISNGILALDKLARGETFEIKKSFNTGTDFIWTILIYILPFLWIALSWMSNSKSWWLGGIFGAIMGFILTGTLLGLGLAAALGLGLDYLLSTKFYGKIKVPRRTGVGGRWGGGSGGFGGGFGGGGFGGGGASGHF